MAQYRRFPIRMRSDAYSKLRLDKTPERTMTWIVNFALQEFRGKFSYEEYNAPTDLRQQWKEYVQWSFNIDLEMYNWCKVTAASIGISVSCLVNEAVRRLYSLPISSETD